MRHFDSVRLVPLCLLLAGAALGGEWTLQPSGFGRHASAEWKPDGPAGVSGRRGHALHFQKLGPTTTFSAAIAVVNGLEGTSAATLSELAWDRKADGRCTTAGPRWELGVSYGERQYLLTFGCSAAAHSSNGEAAWVHDSFSSAQILNSLRERTGVGDPAILTITRLSIIFDEGTEEGPGLVVLGNIAVNDRVWSGPDAGREAR